MMEQYAIKIYYLGLHDEIEHAIRYESEYEACGLAKKFLVEGAWWVDDEHRMVLIPLPRVLRVEVYKQ